MDETNSRLVPIPGQPGLYRCKTLRDAAKKGPVPHAPGANAVCWICGGPAYLGLGLSPPECLSPVCGKPAEVVLPLPNISQLRTASLHTGSVEQFWWARLDYRRRDGVLDRVSAIHPIREEALRLWQEAWKERE